MLCLQVLDVGHCQALWRLPRELLRLSKLTRLVITSMALDQHVVEQLQMRPVPVEVECTSESEEEEEFEDEVESYEWDDVDHSEQAYWDEEDEDEDDDLAGLIPGVGLG